MQAFNQKNLIIGALLLAAFLSVGVFGLFLINHSEHGMGVPMAGCPYTEVGSAVCQNNLDHIAGWQEFSNIILPLVFVLMILTGALYFISQTIFVPPQRFFLHRNSDTQKYFYTGTILKWLSLFENSPSFAYSRHR